MRVSEIGEFGLIRLLCQEFGIEYPPAPGAGMREGFEVDIGDDALVTSLHSEATVWTTDTLVEGVHFLPRVTPWRNTGWKAVAVNVSDIAAMGGRPSAMLVTLCLPADFCVADAVELYSGMKECCEAYGVSLGGGDIVRAPCFSVTVALSGAAATDGEVRVVALRRNAARAGDVLAVTGTLGDSAGGLRLLRAGSNREEAAVAYLIEAHERPEPRLDAGARALAAGLRCGMDISDGLLQDAGHIGRASRVRLRVESGQIPISPQLREKFPDDCLGLALTGGEDYQLLLAGPRASFERLIVEGLDLSIIGEVQPGEPGVTVIDASGAGRTYESAGWDHFRSGLPS